MRILIILIMTGSSRTRREGKTLLYVAEDEPLIGLGSLSDRVREAADVIPLCDDLEGLAQARRELAARTRSRIGSNRSRRKRLGHCCRLSLRPRKRHRTGHFALIACQGLRSITSS